MWRRHDEISRCPVASNRNVPDNCNTQEGFDVWVVRLRLKWIPEEQQHIDFALRDSSADLLVTA
jgi:tRNA(Ile)-lysidine synthase TilS/MesJ